jgi:hypothetical protein
MFVVSYMPVMDDAAGLPASAGEFLPSPQLA